nr:DUF6093 family protein [Arsenicicoccus dermatophilus]
MIHSAWSRAHQAVVIGSMNATCVITDPARETPGVYDDATGTRAAATPYIVVPDGTPCRVVRIREATQAEQAGEEITGRQYRVTVPVYAAGSETVAAGMVVTVTATRDEHTAENIVGTRLTVMERLRGSEEFDRVLICEHAE